MFKAVAFRKARQIEPMPSPSFAVVGGSQQLIDELCVGLWSGIAQESVDLPESWRKASQVET